MKKNADNRSPRANENKKHDLHMGETEVSVSLTSFMTATVFFFIGLLLTGERELQIRLRIAIIYLFLSAFGFLYSTLIYANASGEIARLHKRLFERQMSLGNIVSEYFGVYFLIFAIPIVILGYSPDRVLGVVVFAVCFLGFSAYHFLGFSILERYFARKASFIIVVFLLTLFNASIFYNFFVECYTLYYISSAVVAVAVLGIAVYSQKSREM